MASSSIIKMGNDEFILYIRKKTNVCSLGNKVIGRKIWDWLEPRGATKTKKQPQHAYWIKAEKVEEYMLPEHATQFEFDRAILPELYSYLDELAMM